MGWGGSKEAVRSQVGGRGPGVRSPRGLPGLLPFPAQIALLLLGECWSLEVWLPWGPPKGLHI